MIDMKIKIQRNYPAEGGNEFVILEFRVSIW